MKKYFFIFALIPALAFSQTKNENWNTKVDVSILTSGIVISVIPSFLAKYDVNPTCPPCDPASVNSFDDGALSYHSGGAETASNILVSASLLTPYALSFLSSNDANDHVIYRNMIMLTESGLWSYGIGSWIKWGFQRPRPFAYSLAPSDPKLQESDTYLSRYSTHVSLVASMGTTYTYLLFHDDAPALYSYGSLFLTAAATTGMAFLRVHAGQHFPTDTIAGALGGTAIGLLVPWTRFTWINHSVQVTPGLSSLSLSMRF